MRIAHMIIKVRIANMLIKVISKQPAPWASASEVCAWSLAEHPLQAVQTLRGKAWGGAVRAKLP